MKMLRQAEGGLLTRYILLKMATAGDSGMASHSMLKRHTICCSIEELPS